MEKKKIGIITFHRAINYGAVWQSYALTTYIQSLGHTVEVIDYFPKFLRKDRQHFSKRPWNAVSKLIRIQRFDKFVMKYLKTSSHKYKTESELQETNKLYDVFITGSDTVWNAHIVKNELEVFLLSFADNDKLKTSYAASMGGQDATKDFADLFEHHLRQFGAISLRESLFINSVKQVSGKEEVYEVADPTLLLNKEQYTKKFNLLNTDNSEYIVLLNLSGEKSLDELAFNLKAKTGLPLYHISGNYKKNTLNPIGLSPDKWLKYIYNAKYVCTDSFHGVCFSVIFEKQFYCVGATTGFRKFNNIRVQNLLSKLDLNERYIENIAAHAPMDINYAHVRPKLDKFREESYNFIKLIIR